jgi:hypothetical protein
MPLTKSFVQLQSEQGGRAIETRKGWTVVIVGIVVSLMMGISAALAAADYPTRAMDYVIPFGPGGGRISR